MTETLNTQSVQWLGVAMLIMTAYVCVCLCESVCCRVSRWVYVIMAVQADAELIV